MEENSALHIEGEAHIEAADPLHNAKMSLYVDKEALSSAIEEGINKGLEDILAHFKKQGRLFIFALLGILAMLAVIALVLSSFHNLPLH